MQFPRTLVEFQDQFPVRNIVGRTYATPAGRAVLFARAAAAAAATSWRADASSSAVPADIELRSYLTKRS